MSELARLEVRDGIGLISLFEAFIDLSRQAPPPPEVDLDRVIAEARAEEHHDGQAGPASQYLASVAAAAGRLWRLPLSAGQRAVREAALLTVDPLRAKGRPRPTEGSDDSSAGPRWGR